MEFQETRWRVVDRLAELHELDSVGGFWKTAFKLTQVLFLGDFSG